MLFARSLTLLPFLFVSIIAGAQNISIVSPTASTVGSPVRVVANFSSTAPIDSISVLLDSVEVAHPEAVTPLDIDVPMSAGSHLLTINAVQSDGLQLTASRSVDVSAPVTAMSATTTSSTSASGPSDDTAGVPMTTSGGTSTVSHIEEKSGWYMYPDQGNPDCSSKPNLMSSPSLDGTSGRFSLAPNGQFNNCLWPIRLGKSTTATHFTLNTYYQLSNPSASQGIEFSSNKHVDTKWYKFSVQCSYYKGVFSVWDTAGGKWSATNIPCKRPGRYTWEHLVVQTEISNGKAVFKSLTHNGVTYAINKSFYPKKSSSAYSFGVHFQMNGNRGGDSYYAWVDNLKFTLW